VVKACGRHGLGVFYMDCVDCNFPNGHQLVAEYGELAAANARIAELEADNMKEAQRADFFHAESKNHLDTIFELSQSLDTANARLKSAGTSLYDTRNFDAMSEALTAANARADAAERELARVHGFVNEVMVERDQLAARVTELETALASTWPGR
jgi:predicted  nucleic acid-binding Zn-ribbon protein